MKDRDVEGALKKVSIDPRVKYILVRQNQLIEDMRKDMNMLAEAVDMYQDALMSMVNVQDGMGQKLKPLLRSAPGKGWDTEGG